MRRTSDTPRCAEDHKGVLASASQLALTGSCPYHLEKITRHQMNASHLAIQVRDAAETFASLIAQRQLAEVDEVRQAALRCKPLIEVLWQSTIHSLKPYLICGSPASIMRLVGLSRLEKPFNRILKWCADERGDHGFGREFLKQLCAALQFDEMSRCLETDEVIDVWGEEKIDSSGNMPDLVVRTRNPDGAALMLENKVGSPESGDQYGPYRDWFEHFAGPRKRFCVLSARNRLVSDGWKCVTHEELAQVFRAVARTSGVPIWSRIVAIQCAAAFEDRETDRIADLIRATNRNDRIGILDWRTVLAFQPSANPSQPWKLSL